MPILPADAAPWTWQGNEDPTLAALEIIAHPACAEAARGLARNTLHCGDEDRALGAVFSDAGHYVAAMWTLYLHAGGGMTLAQLKDICAASGFASPGRARLLLQFLQHIGFVEPASSPGRTVHYLPTDLFMAAWRRHLQGALAAAAMIDARIAPVGNMLDDPETFAAFLRVQAGRLQRIASGTSDVPPFERIFMQRLAGLQIVSLMVASGDGRDVLANEAIHISPRAAAARFGVSHMHVRRLLADAEAAGLLRRLGHADHAPTDTMRDTVRFFFAMQLAELITSARLMLEALVDAPTLRIVTVA